MFSGRDPRIDRSRKKVDLTRGEHSNHLEKTNLTRPGFGVEKLDRRVDKRVRAAWCHQPKFLSTITSILLDLNNHVYQRV